jgi:chromosome segregation protein
MYLKKIIAQGFKSFADKIVIDLENNITGIVGPNGSGKSNVVDAIRWVLGEQSVKSLRGEGNMTDVIFQGSKSRNASNVASVSLIFDNSDHYINLNFSEISIKRRVYRDGTNEYYLNNEQCRLKDITNILLDSGMAKESFNIISQGQIEEIISAKPIDRRVMIEEAASVLKYKHRKEEALRKLEKTNDNISRVNDIISELEKRVEPLKNERDKALKKIDLKEELESIEVALISSDITNLNYKYQDNKRRIDILNNELTSITTSNSSNEARLLDYKVKQNKVDIKLKELRDKILELTELSERLNSQKKIILERKKYEVDDAKLHENVIALKEKQLKIENDINLVLLEINKNKEHLSGILERVHKKNDDFEHLKQNKVSLDNRLSNEYRNNINLNQKISSLKDMIENNSLLPQAVRSILDNPKLAGIHDIIGNLIEIDDKYQKSITTILGVNVNNIVVDDEEKAKRAIEYLKQNNLGRATFFPLSIIKEKTIKSDDLHILNEYGCIGVASSLVKYDKKYKNIIENQLGNILVVDNIDNANKISRKLNYRYRIVTLDGEVLHVGGSLTGGNVKQKDNIILLKYELEEVIQKQKIALDNIKEIENQINDNDYNIKSVEDELYLINKEKVNTDEIINSKMRICDDLKKDLEEVISDLNGTQNILDGKLTLEEENILKEYYDSVKKKDEVANSISILEDEKNEIEEERQQFEYQVRKENNAFNLKNKELKELEIETNRLDVKLDTLLNTLNETYNMTYEKATSLYKLELDLEVAREKVNSLKKELRDIGEVNLNAPKEYEEISTRYEFLITQREDLISAENTLLDIIKEMDNVMIQEFMKTFKTINVNFESTFKELFRGGTASLKLTDPDNILETGIEIVACPPGKKLKNLSLLSGGEKTFTAISLLFAILKSRPVPFCVLDEVEAALDEVNVDSFGNYVKHLQQKTQFIIITHKKKTMEYADTLYGITMQESGVSKLVSVKLESLV